MKTLENKFHEDMVNIYYIAKKDLKYTASRFFQMVSNDGGLTAAKHLIAKKWRNLRI